MACGVRGAPLGSVVACGCGVRRRVAAAKASARQGQRGHEPGRLLSLAATLMLLARRSTEDPPERREAVQRPRAGLLARASPAASTGKEHAAVGGGAVMRARQAAVIGHHADAAGPEIDGGSAREARGRSTPPRRPAAAGAPSFKPAHGPSLFHLVFIVVRRNNWWSMGSKVGKKHGESTSHGKYFLLPL